DRLRRVKRLLDRNRIQWTNAPVGSYLGLNYETGRMSQFRSAAGDIVINANQPKSNLLRVLLERQSRFSDSITYDITAWSIPFVYGLQAYGLNNYVSGAASSSEPAVYADVEGSDYAYAVRWSGLNSAQFLSQLLQKGVKVRYAERPFQALGANFDRGTLLITLAGNGAAGPGLRQTVMDCARQTGVNISKMASGFVDKGPDFGSDLVRMVHAPRVALVTGDQVSSQEAGEVWHLFEQELHYPVTLINAPDIGQTSWKDFDVLILPNGNYRFLGDKTVTEGLMSWVREGGRLIAMQDAVAQLAKGDWGIREKGEEAETQARDDSGRVDDDALLLRYGDREREEAESSVRGAIYRIELDNTHPLAFGYPDHYYTLKQDNNVYEFMREGWNVGVIRKEGYISGFTGTKAKERLKEGLIFGVLNIGRGNVVCMADDPLFRSFWENGKLLFCNAVFLVGQ
ncbi:MAG TPA: zinc carboxypeptidase, partial [Puia sp.]|nr:zinc carboxypeptidase [Puia sp.]